MLEIKEIYKTFNAGTINEKRAMNGVSLTLNDGDFVTVIGGNGAGKSTLLNLVAGVYPVDSGSIVIDGQDVTRLPEHKRAKFIGRVFQDPMMGTAATMQIEENLALAARRGQGRSLRPGITRAEREQYKELLKILDLGLEDRLTSKVGLLSGGQRQALTLLMATLKKPKLLLLDEHTAALDPKTAAKVLDTTEKIVQRDKLTTLMITHNMRDAIAHGNRLIMMYEGRIAVDVSGEEKKKLTVEQLLNLFSKARGSEEAADKLLLGKSGQLPHGAPSGMGRPLAAQAFCLWQNLGAGGIHFRRACEKTREATEGRGFLSRPSVGGSCSTCSARPAGRTRRTTSCCWDKAVSCSTGPHRRWGGACAVQAFCRRQNLGAGGIHFRRACEKTREPTEGRGKSPAPQAVEKPPVKERLVQFPRPQPQELNQNPSFPGTCASEMTLLMA